MINEHGSILDILIFNRVQIYQHLAVSRVNIIKLLLDVDMLFRQIIHYKRFQWNMTEK